MTARLRIAVAVAILLVLAAHPLVHPVAKECPCVHAVTTAVERSETFVLPLAACRFEPLLERHVETPAVASRASRAPPTA